MSRKVITPHEEDTAIPLTTPPSKAGAEPLTVSVFDARRITGMSNTELYRCLAAQKIRAVKCGTRTLIMMDSLRHYIASLPQATFGKTTTAE
ncbi:MAG: hypothetical protein JOY71_12965 [Acetobacteraceae bacterium]|nr:hypothetical protein [Acetobacteraceae bacterium]